MDLCYTDNGELNGTIRSWECSFVYFQKVSWREFRVVPDNLFLAKSIVVSWYWHNTPSSTLYPKYPPVLRRIRTNERARKDAGTV